MKRGLIMFNVTGNFSRGACTPTNQVNGFQTMVMQRQMDLDNIIRDFEAAIAAGYNPNANEVQSQILNKYSISKDLTLSEMNYIESRVEKIYQAKRGYN